MSVKIGQEVAGSENLRAGRMRDATAVGLRETRVARADDWRQGGGQLVCGIRSGGAEPRSLRGRRRAGCRCGSNGASLLILGRITGAEAKEGNVVGRAYFAD